jgi:hypothetical protein
MKFFSQNDGLREITHRPPQPAAFAAHIQVGLLFANAVTVLQNSFRAFNDFPGFERPFHFERFGNEARILDRERRLARNGLGKSDLFGAEGSLLARVNIQRADNLQARKERDGQQGSQS